MGERAVTFDVHEIPQVRATKLNRLAEGVASNASAVREIGGKVKQLEEAAPAVSQDGSPVTIKLQLAAETGAANAAIVKAGSEFRSRAAA